MTNIFKISTVALTAILALAGAAQADGVKISTLGKSQAALHNEVVQAAKSVCEQAVASDVRDVYGSMDECVSATETATFAKIAAPSAGLAMAKQSVQVR
jgi:hypothetical protein